MKIKGIEFDVEVDWDMDGKIERLAVFVVDPDDELSEVLSDEVMKRIEEEAYRNRQDLPEDDPSEDR